MYKPVSMATRRALCKKFKMQCYWEGKENEFDLRGTRGVRLEAPPFMTSAKRLAEGAGECLFSSIYYLLCGRESG